MILKNFDNFNEFENLALDGSLLMDSYPQNQTTNSNEDLKELPVAEIDANIDPFTSLPQSINSFSDYDQQQPASMPSSPFLRHRYRTLAIINRALIITSLVL